MKQFNLELTVGIFLVLGFLSFAWLALRLGEVGIVGRQSYPLTARFGSVAGLKEGAVVQVAGVQVGEVEKITLDQEYYDAIVHLSIEQGVHLQEDSIASIRTTGIIGEKYVSISPGGSPEILPPGGAIVETESSVSLEELISKYIFQGK